MPTGPDWRLVLTQLQKPKLAVDVAPRIQCRQRGTYAAGVLHFCISHRNLGCVLHGFSRKGMVVQMEQEGLRLQASTNVKTCGAKHGEICRASLMDVVAIGFISSELY